ncbi:hypothetical protein D7Z54_35100, partial [Salibacterium salarium]
LRQQWQEVNARKYDGIKPSKDDQDCACSACGQDLPENQVEAAHEKAMQSYEANLAEFNQRKAQQLEDIKAAGTQKKEKDQRAGTGYSNSSGRVDTSKTATRS